jgi:hypothetical protein
MPHSLFGADQMNKQQADFLRSIPGWVESCQLVYIVNNSGMIRAIDRARCGRRKRIAWTPTYPDGKPGDYPAGEYQIMSFEAAVAKRHEILDAEIARLQAKRAEQFQPAQKPGLLLSVQKQLTTES